MNRECYRFKQKIMHFGRLEDLSAGAKCMPIFRRTAAEPRREGMRE
jgi:hypothetical protein